MNEWASANSFIWDAEAFHEEYGAWLLISENILQWSFYVITLYYFLDGLYIFEPKPCQHKKNSTMFSYIMIEHNIIEMKLIILDFFYLYYNGLNIVVKKISIIIFKKCKYIF